MKKLSKKSDSKIMRNYQNNELACNEKLSNIQYLVTQNSALVFQNNKKLNIMI